MTLDEYIATLQEMSDAGHGGLRVVKEYDCTYDDLDRGEGEDDILTLGLLSEDYNVGFVEPGDDDYTEDPDPSEFERVVCIRQ